MMQSPFLQSVYEYMLARHYSRRTIKAYLYWIKGFIVFNNKRHPTDLGVKEVEAFLTHLSVKRNVAPGTQSVALNSVVFLYKNIINRPLGDIGQFRRARREPKLPVVLTTDEVVCLLKQLKRTQWLVAALMYGSGLRRVELVRLRVKDIDFDHLQIRVWSGKGGKNRVVTLAKTLIEPLKNQIHNVEQLMREDALFPDYCGVYMPNALARKYPSGPFQLGWQYLFPSGRRSVEPGTSNIRRHHLDESGINKFIRGARYRAGITKDVTSHTLRHCFATHTLASVMNTGDQTVQANITHWHLTRIGVKLTAKSINRDVYCTRIKTTIKH